MHSLPTLAVFKSEYWNAYIEVNNNFAVAVLDTLKKIEAQNQNSLAVQVYTSYLILIKIV